MSYYTLAIVLFSIVAMAELARSCPCRNKSQNCYDMRFSRSFGNCRKCEDYVRENNLNSELLPTSNGGSPTTRRSLKYCRNNNPLWIYEIKCLPCRHFFGITFRRSKPIQVPNYECLPCGKQWYPVLKPKIVGCTCLYDFPL